MPKDAYIPCLLRLFRQYGYDGATLAKISEATGLGKASLYHHFPGGKEEMVTTVLAHLEQRLEQHLLQPLRAEGTVLERFQHMAENISALYEGGQQPCLFAILLMGSVRDIYQAKLQFLLQTWVDAIALVLIDAGVEAILAQQRGEDAVIAVQGSLILSQGLNTREPFQRTLQKLPQQLCQDLGE
jgi:TetR/AcrR family transcriptional regulator, lmrAB and yxaGH operons repressor